MPNTSKNKLNLGCTLARHERIGINAVINARGGLGDSLNNQSLEDIELMRDARKIQDWKLNRIRFYQLNSKFCRRNISHFQHLFSNYND